MSMKREAGIHIGAFGVGDFVSDMRRAKRAYKSYHDSVRRQAADIGGSFKQVARDAATFVAKVGVAASAATAAAVAVPYHLAKGREQLSRFQRDLRMLSMTETEIREVEERARQFGNRYGLAYVDAFTEAYYDIQSTVGELNAKTKAKMLESSILGGATVKMDTKQAADYLTAMWGSLKNQYKEKGPQEFTEMVWAQTQKAVEILKTTGPQLREGLSHSSAVAGQMGWKLEDMLGTLAVLNTGSFKPEQAGTGLRNLIQSSPEGLAKIMARTETERIGGKGAWGQLESSAQKAIIERMKKEVASRELVRHGPVPIMRELNRLLQGYGREEKQALVEEAFGRETMSQVTALMTAVDQLEKKIKAIRDSDYDTGVMGRVDHALQYGIDAALDRTRVRWDNLKKLAARSFEPAVVGGLDWLSDKFWQWQEYIKERENEILGSVNAFSARFSAAFKKSFEFSPDTTNIVREIADALDKPDPQKWAKIGGQIGELAGTSLSEFAKSIDQIASALKTIADIADPVAKAFGWVAGTATEGYRLWGKHAAPHLASYYERLKAHRESGGLTRDLKEEEELDTEEKRQPRGPTKTGRAPERMAPSPSPADAGWLAGLKGYVDSLVAGGRPEFAHAGPRARDAEQPIIIHNHSKTTVEVDRRAIGEAVNEHIATLRDRDGAIFSELW